MKKKAILVVSFGTSYHDTCKRNIQAIEEAIASAFPQWEVRRAFTSGMIRQKLKEQSRIQVDSVEEALQRLADEGFHTVLCQPTHVINGEEYDDIKQAAAKFASVFSALKVGVPLLNHTDDYKRLVEIFSDIYPAQEDTVYCLMGHGSKQHPADAAYAALDYHFKAMERADICVGTVEGFPDFHTMLHDVCWLGATRYVLIPLMVVAGDHATNDMASKDENSWRSMLEQKGYTVDCVMRGMGEYPQVRDLYIQHLLDWCI